MKKPNENTIRLRGVRSAAIFFSNKAWLNGTFLRLEKSLKAKAHSLRGFNWGNDEKGVQLALEIA